MKAEYFFCFIKKAGIKFIEYIIKGRSIYLVLTGLKA